MLEAPATIVELAYETTKRLDMQEGIFSSTIAKEDTCFNDIFNIKLPKSLCPFGCKKKECPYDWDKDKCPHNLSEKSIEELAEYALKAFYHGDENIEADYSSKIDPKLLKAVQQYKRRGNYEVLERSGKHGASRQNNNKV